MTIPLTGNNQIDGLMIPASFTGNAGESASATFAFENTVTENVFMNAVRSALSNMSDFANITFQEISNPNSANLRFDWTENVGSSNPNALGRTTFLGFPEDNHPTFRIGQADINISKTFHPVSDLAVGQNGYITIIHETGHAVGLEHPFEGQAVLTGTEASFDVTVMANNANGADFADIPVTYMLYDIQAIQHLYGANTSVRTGNDTYTFSDATNQDFTIWDGGGIDIINQSSTTSDVFINLSVGADRPSFIGNSVIWNAFNANIENATSGSGNDTISANGLGNVLRTNDGNDSIRGFSGNDDARGGNGNDTIEGGNDNDFINGNQGSDSVSGDDGNDVVRGGKDNDTVNGGTGNDTTKGDIGADIVMGDSGDDISRGGKDNDSVFGNDGNDSIFGDLGNDTLSGGNGSDTFVFRPDSGVDVISDFVVGQDFIRIFASVIGSAAEAVAAFSNGTLNLGGGNTVTITGVSSLSESDFIIT